MATASGSTTASLAGRTYLVTGANTGIGKETARALAAGGGTVILACRSLDKTQPVVDELRRDTGNDRVEAIGLDLADLASVRRCAEELLATDRPIHVLVNNAGLAGVRGQTKDGFELAFGTNHVGHYLLTRLLLDRLRRSAGPGAPARIVNVSSESHYAAKGIDWGDVRRPTRTVLGLHEYEVSKLANVLFTAELARRLPAAEVTTYALHPGVIGSDIWQRRAPRPLAWVAKKLMKSTTDGARTSIWCATAPELSGETGHYYDNQREKRPSRVSQDEALARTLWDKSAEWTGLPA
ncbi:MAG TPA: SDR family oxidoreductase [Kofleriaceae bacterium]|jgi:NAD(P)-dependent dehydrogenase (short-subunit alcohol dehydrogenase family)|nr:SDR family oxidoreductase [Kofleriaceae bacterium]